MDNEFLIRQTMMVFAKIATNLINRQYKIPHGGATVRLVSKALDALGEKVGGLSRERIVDYVICSAYVFKDRGCKWRIEQVFGPKSIERFDSDRGRRYYEDRWLKSAGLSRDQLLRLIADRSDHPQSKYIYMPMEESTKRRLLNQHAGYVVCQSSTLGWSPFSECCMECSFAEQCKRETGRKFPEIFRLRLEYDFEK